MNKSKLIESMAKTSKLPKSVCKKAIEAFIKAVFQSLRSGKPVSLTNFGRFSIMQRQARWGVNPASGEKMKIKAKKTAKFKPGKALRELVS